MFSPKDLVVAALGVLALASPSVGTPTHSHGQILRHTACQTIGRGNPLHGCPKGTIYISGSDKRAHFSTINGALKSLPHDNSAHTILIGEGNYTEQLNITRPGPVTLLGEVDPWTAWKPYSDVTYDKKSENKVQIWQATANGAGRYPDNVFASVLIVAPTYNASVTGAGRTGYPVDPNTPMGNSDFKAYNIDFRNEFAPRSSGPSHAFSISYANASFYSCGFYSWQDTVYVGKLGNVYLRDAVVAGQTDFVYGFGTLWIEKSTLVSRSCGHVTAMKGTNTTFVNKYGAYISNSRLIANNQTVLEGSSKCALGRPWNPLHRSVFLRTYFDENVAPEGYQGWAGQVNENVGVNTTMALYKTYGPGNNVTAQKASPVTKIFDKRQVAPYSSPLKVFMTPQGKQPNIKWIDPLALLG